MAEAGIQKTFESPGVFWLPQTPNTTVPGELSHTSEDGPQIKLLGGLGMFPGASFPVVYGILDDAPCTLFNCRQNSSSNSYGGLHQTGIEAGALLVGEHVPSLDELIFVGAKVRFGGLDEWVNFKSIHPGTAEGTNSISRFDLITQPLIISNVEVIDGTVALIGEQSGSYSGHKIEWQYHSFFKISLNKPASVNALLKCVSELQRLFALLTYTRAPMSYFSLSRPVPVDRMNPKGMISCGLYGHWPMASREEKASSHLLTHLPNLAGEMPQIIAGWFQSPPTVKIARNLFASIIRSEGQYLQFKFLALMQAVEATHRSVENGDYTSKDAYEEIHKALTNAIPASVGSDHRASLKSRIRYGNEFSLRKRFKRLFEKLPKGLTFHICNDYNVFLTQAVDMRNALTHPATDGTAVEPDSTEMSKATRRISLLLIIIFLHELGLPFEKIEKIAMSLEWQTFVLD